MQKFNVETVVMSSLQDVTDFNILVTVMLCVNIHHMCFLMDINKLVFFRKMWCA